MAVVSTRYWHRLPDGRLQCDVCPRACRLRDGQRGFCFVRERRGDEIVLTAYGKASGLAIDPIEKKPLHHFLPGSSVLSFGTAGCNLACRFCQNWELSAARAADATAVEAEPEWLADAAVRSGCESVAFTYNDPAVFLEYAVDTARACRRRGVASVAVTAAYTTPDAAADLLGACDAANVDLKAPTDEFYRRLCGGRIAPVQEVLRWLVGETQVWTEVTTLLIPGHNDGDDEVAALSRWIAEDLGPDVPLHLSAFHPAHRMRHVPPTPLATLRRARRIARSQGLRFVYTGNVRDPEGEATSCPSCGAVLIERRGYTVRLRDLDEAGRCRRCAAVIPGRFDRGELPGSPGGARR